MVAGSRGPCTAVHHARPLPSGAALVANGTDNVYSGATGGHAPRAAAGRVAYHLIVCRRASPGLT